MTQPFKIQIIVFLLTIFSDIGCNYVPNLTPLRNKSISIVEQREIFDIKRKLKLPEVVESIEKNKFDAFADGQSDPGLADGVVWVRLKLKTRNLSETEKLILILRNPFIDEAELYFLQENSNVSLKLAGEYRRGRDQERSIPSWFVTPGISFRMKPLNEQIFLLRFESKTMLKSAVTIDLEPNVHYLEVINIIFKSFYFGAIFALFLYNFFIFLSTKETSYFSYLMYLTFFGIFQVQYAGLTANMFEDSWFYHKLQLATAGLSISATALFVLIFLRMREVSKTFFLLLVNCSIFGVAIFLFSPFESLHVILMNALAVNVLCFLLIGSTSAWLAFRKGFTSARFFLISSLLNFVMIGIEIHYTSTGQPYSFLGEHALKFGSLSEAVLLSLALADRINFLQKENLRVQEEHFQEKKRIMRDLHDAVGSGLTQILYLIREKDSRKRIGLEETAQETLLKLRDLVFLLNREKDFSVYLIQEMKTFLARIKTIGKYEMNIDFRYANQLNSKDSLHLYYIFCECLTNIVKHAKADLIQIKLVSYGKWVFLVISDNGIGMQMTKNNLQEGTGLSNIRFRINELQGKMRIAKKNGTAIFFMIPKKILK